MLRRLISEYKKNRHNIKKRLKEFRDLYKGRDKDVFAELCFCILTPQSKAVNCDRAVRELKKSGLLFRGARGAIKLRLKGVRFPNNKAGYIIAARNLLKNKRGIKEMLDIKNPLETREWFVKNVKGIGYKEASHFLRNIGMGKDTAILDVHILKNLKRYGVIKEIPLSLNRTRYMDIESKMRRFSSRIRIPLDELDLLFWAKETGFIFK